MKHHSWVVTNGQRGKARRYLALAPDTSIDTTGPADGYWTVNPGEAILFRSRDDVAKFFPGHLPRAWLIVPYVWGDGKHWNQLENAVAIVKYRLQNSWVATVILDIQHCLRERRYKRMIARIEKSERIRKATTVPPMQPLLPKQERVARQIAKQARDEAMARNRKKVQK